MLSNEAITEFKKLYLKKYKILLTDTEVQEYGTRLIGLIRAVYGQNLPTLLDIEARKDDN